MTTIATSLPDQILVTGNAADIEILAGSAVEIEKALAAYHAKRKEVEDNNDSVEDEDDTKQIDNFSEGISRWSLKGDKYEIVDGYECDARNVAEWITYNTEFTAKVTDMNDIALSLQNN